jgi:alpha-L-fucosidase
MKRIKFTLFLMFLAGDMMNAFAQIENLPVCEGKYKPTDESLKTYKYPEWFKDAKFGIWACWGPQAVPRQGDWYARGMYERDYFDCGKNEYRKANRY